MYNATNDHLNDVPGFLLPAYNNHSKECLSKKSSKYFCFKVVYNMLFYHKTVFRFKQEYTMIYFCQYHV